MKSKKFVKEQIHNLIKNGRKNKEILKMINQVNPESMKISYSVKFF